MKINYLKTYLPVSIRRGNSSERLSKAEELTRTFNIKLQNAFKFGDVSEKGLITIFKKSIKYPIPIDIIPEISTGKAYVMHSSNEFGLVEGYTMQLPFNRKTNGLSEKNTNIILKQTMLLFQEMLNPKYFQRMNLLVNRDFKLIGQCNQFYNDKIYTKNYLSIDEFNNFLKGKKLDEKINILQFFRQSITKEINAQKFLKKDKEEFHLIRKLRLIDERLMKEITTVRNRTKKSVLAKNSNV